MKTIFYYLQNLIYIAEGYTKWFYDIITGHAAERAKKRIDICHACTHNKKGICEICGCILKAKVRVDYPLDNAGISIDGCPERKW